MPNTVSLERDGHVLLIGLNRPHKRNSFDREMLADLSRVGPSRGSTWVIWLITAAVLSLAGAAFIARLINRPLKQLSFAASRMRDGDFDASLLDTLATQISHFDSQATETLATLREALGGYPLPLLLHLEEQLMNFDFEGAATTVAAVKAALAPAA